MRAYAQEADHPIARSIYSSLLSLRFAARPGQQVVRATLLRSIRTNSVETCYDPFIQTGNANTAQNQQQITNNNTVHQINHGTPVVLAIDLFNTLMAPLQWINIGSRIDEGIPLDQGTPPVVDYTIENQVYPTYSIYERSGDGGFYLMNHPRSLFTFWELQLQPLFLPFSQQQWASALSATFKLKLMNISKLNMIMTFVAGCFLAVTNLHAQSAAPQIDCKIIVVSNHVGEAVTPATSILDLPNGERIGIEIGLKTTDLNDPVAPNSINPNPIPPNGQYFLLKVIRESDGAEIPVKITTIGGDKNLNYLTNRIYLEIPDSPEIRLAKVTAAWDKIKAQQTGSVLNVPDPKMVAALEQQLVENQLGHFKIICSYVSNKPGTWNGQVTATSLRINVVDKGTYLDKLVHSP